MGMDPGRWVASGPEPVAAAGEGGRFGAAGARRLTTTTMRLAGDWGLGGAALLGACRAGLLAVGMTHITSPSHARAVTRYWTAGGGCKLRA